MLLLGVSGKRNIYGKIYLVLYIELLGSLQRDIGDSESVGIAIDTAAGGWHSTHGSRPVAFCEFERCGELHVGGVGTLTVGLIVVSCEQGVPLHRQGTEVVADVALEQVVGLTVLVEEITSCRCLVA